MLFNLIEPHLAWLESNGLGFLRLIGDPDYIHFRALMAVILSFTLVVLFGRRTIRVLIAMKIRDNPEFYRADVNQLMSDKNAVPTMGGILIAGAILTSTLLLADLGSFYVHMALLCLLWLAMLGGVDDYLKLIGAQRQPGSRDGLFMHEKLLFQFGLAVVLGLFIHNHGINNDELGRQMAFSLNLPLLKTWDFNEQLGGFEASRSLILLPSLAFVLITVLVIAGSSNAVNLTDGMDGLAAGIMAICAFAFTGLALIAGQESLAKQMLIPYIPKSSELAIVAGAMAGSCVGFLWFNCHPASVFMGDTGSLPLGGLLGYIAVVTRQEFLLLVIGGIFVLEALSVVLQIGYYKFTGGKRIFRCAPIHYHFHLGGWTEQQVVVRFWLITAILAAIAVATLNLR